jgi:release factor glutamine methyltransferase
MKTVGAWLRDAAERLAPVTETPRLDAEILLASVLGYSRARLLASNRDQLEATARDQAEELLRSRLDHEPIAYILGEWEFYSLTLKVRPPMLVPRPETEHLVEAALEHLTDCASARVLDLCTGTGCVALAIAHNAPQSSVTATDLNRDAVGLAEENTRFLGCRLEAYHGDLFHALPEGTPPFDVIVSNPPYVPDAEWDTLSPVIRHHEDRAALLGGTDGLDLVRTIINDAPAHLVHGGLLALEVGEGQAEDTARYLTQRGFSSCGFVKDLQDIPRIVRAWWP